VILTKEINGNTEELIVNAVFRKVRHLHLAGDIMGFVYEHTGT
jgi:hypothetical protein